MGPGDSAILHVSYFSASRIRSLKIWYSDGLLFIPEAFTAEINSMDLFLCWSWQSAKYDSKIDRSNDDGESTYPDPMGLSMVVIMKF